MSWLLNVDFSGVIYFNFAAHLVCEVYEDALLQDPTNEELLSSLFMSYVRVCDYKKQQQTALALHKVKPNNPYYFWAVMSIVMQVNNLNLILFYF